ncbi:MAG: hypothetical protein AB7K24_01335 [Gemmataceae bacterium]
MRFVLHLIHRSWKRWEHYWTGPGFHWSYGICRIALGLIFIQLISAFPADYQSHLESRNANLYNPVGILRLFGPTLPDASFFQGCRDTLTVTAWLVLVGLFSRLSMAVTVFCLLCLCSLTYSFDVAWCHGFPPVLLPAIAMLFGPRSTISIDQVARLAVARLRQGPTSSLSSQLNGARGPVLLAQLAVALVFFNAAAFKIYLTSHEPFAWVYSDNMRNILLLQYWVLDEPLPSTLNFVVSHSWAYKAMALGNIVAQCTPILACFLIRWPLLRACCGLVFITEVALLDAVMGLPNPIWFYLFAFFVDWDRLFQWLGTRLKVRLPVSALPDQPARWMPITQTVWASLYLSFYLYVAFLHGAEQRRYTFPFTAFPMYSSVMANKPYGAHLPYHLYGSVWEIDADPPITREQFNPMWRSYYSAPWYTPDMHERAMAVKAFLESRCKTRISGMRIQKTLYQIPKYPDPTCKPVVGGLVYCFADSGHCSLSATLETDTSNPARPLCLNIQQTGLREPQYRCAFYSVDPSVKENVDSVAATAIEGEWRKNRFYFAKPAPGMLFLVIFVRDQALGKDEVRFAGPILY